MTKLKSAQDSKPLASTVIYSKRLTFGNMKPARALGKLDLKQYGHAPPGVLLGSHPWNRCQLRAWLLKNGRNIFLDLFCAFFQLMSTLDGILPDLEACQLL